MRTVRLWAAAVTLVGATVLLGLVAFDWLLEDEGWPTVLGALLVFLNSLDVLMDDWDRDD